MVEDWIGRLIQALTRRTENASIPWEPTARRGTFMANIGPTSVSIGYVEETQYVFGHHLVTILDEEGAEVESMEVYPNSPWYQEVSTLHTAARRKAFDVEERLDRLLQELE